MEFCISYMSLAINRKCNGDAGMQWKKNKKYLAFSAWLVDKRLANSEQLTHLVRWVDRFRRFARTRPRDCWQDALTVFLENLEEGETVDWQIRQAGEAVSLYCGQFISSHPQWGNSQKSPPLSDKSFIKRAAIAN